MEKIRVQLNETHVIEVPEPEPEPTTPAPQAETYRNTTREALEILLGINTQSDVQADPGMTGPSFEGGEEEPEIITAARNLRSKLTKEGIL